MSDSEKKGYVFHKHEDLILLIGFMIAIVSLFYITRDSSSTLNESDKKQSKATIQPLIDQKKASADSLLINAVNRLTSLFGEKQKAQDIRIILNSDYQKGINKAPDTCASYINAVYKDCQRLDSINQKIIRKQDSSLVEYSQAASDLKDALMLTEFQKQQKSDSISSLIKVNGDLKKEVKKEHRKGNLKGIGGFILGALSGFGGGKISP